MKIFDSLDHVIHPFHESMVQSIEMMGKMHEETCAMKDLLQKILEQLSILNIHIEAEKNSCLSVDSHKPFYTDSPIPGDTRGTV